MSGDDKGYGLNVAFNSINSGYRLPLNQQVFGSQFGALRKQPSFFGKKDPAVFSKKQVQKIKLGRIILLIS